MREVSCRVFEIFFKPLRRRKLDPQLLVVGTAIDLATLRDKNARIDWSDFVIIMANLGRVMSEAELLDAGRNHFRAPLLRVVSVFAPLVFSARDFYRWAMSPEKGVGTKMFTCATPSIRELPDGRLELHLTLADGFEMCPGFFKVTQGNLIEMPRLLGLPEAKVRLDWEPRGALYTVDVPTGGAVLRRIKLALLWPFTARAAARELKDAHESLQQRYLDLEEARLRLHQQATQLRTAHRVNEVIQGDLDLDRTVETVASALVQEAGFEGVEVTLSTEVDGLEISRRVDHGTIGDAEPLERPLMRRGGQVIGGLRAYPAASAVRSERDELLAFIVPAVAMALENAISYEVLSGYRKGLEARVAERTSEVTRAHDCLRETVVHLEEARRVRDGIFANVNHEIRTPLSLVMLAVAEARAKRPTTENDGLARSLDFIELGARRLLRMVDELLLLAESREGELKLDLGLHDLAALVESIVDAWRPAATNESLSLECTTRTCIVEVDPAAIERALMNLLSNAVKFTPPGGRIDVSLAVEGKTAVLEVRDTGVGIDEALKARLFGRFERADRKTAGGSGLGLSIVKELVTAQRGEVDATNRPEGGSLFRVRLPLAKAAGRPESQKSLSLRPSDFGAIGSQPRDDEPQVFEPPGTPAATILLAEDDVNLRKSIVGLLTDRYRVFVAGDGQTALEIAAREAPDLLLTDIDMPGMDGVELTRRFRALHNTRVAPVLILTAFSGARAKLAGFDAGAVDYVLKPFEPDELRARIRSQLAMRALALQLLESEKLATIGTLSAGLAHEIRNPANGIVNAVEPLRELLPPELLRPGEPVAELLKVIQHCSQQVAALSKHLLGFRRNAVLERTTISLDGLIARVRANAGLQGLELRQNLEYRGPVSCSEVLLTQALTNLLNNAAVAAGRGGWIELRATKEAASVVFELTDSGPGVAAHLRERIFEPFFTTKAPGQGTGLGLSIAREIALRHGGSLDLREVAGRTIFRLEIPSQAG